MAVQAQYPLNAFIPEFGNRYRNNVLDALQLHNHEQQNGNLFRGYNYVGQVLNGTVFSDPESELTCNVSGSRKRNREEQQMAPTQQQQQQQQQQQHEQISQRLQFANLCKIQEKNGSISTGLQLSYDEKRMNQSGGTSTSGRSPAIAAAPLLTPLSHDLISYTYQQNLKIDSFIRLQNEQLRLGLEETRKRHCRALFSILEQQIQKKLKEKDLELENVTRINAELEEKVKQMIIETEFWQKVAKNNEAIASNLRTSLEQALVQNMAGQGREGYGDSEGIATLADDAQSCCYEAEEEQIQAKTLEENCELIRRKTCKVCRQNEVSVLLLPCRHLCLCKDCESKLDYCPLCKSMKNASLQIFMS